MKGREDFKFQNVRDTIEGILDHVLSVKPDLAHNAITEKEIPLSVLFKTETQMKGRV